MSNKFDATVIDPKLQQYATERQWEIYQAVFNQGSQQAAADSLGISRSTVVDAIKALKKKAVQHGYAPEYSLIHAVPEGMRSSGPSILFDELGDIRGYWNKMKLQGLDREEAFNLPDPKRTVKVSTLTDNTGKVLQQWVSEKPEDTHKENLWLEFAKQLAADLPRINPTPFAGQVEKDLCLALPVGDHHLGMLAWHEESGDDYDMKIAEELLIGAFKHLLDAAPACETVLIPFMGDLAHYDSMKPVTPAHQNIVDADSRFPKMIKTLIRVIRTVIEMCLERHKKVHVIFEIGNHDPVSTIFLQEMFNAFYENEPRITVDTSPMHFHYFRWGKVLIGTHHGHGVKMDKLPLIMAHDRKEDWGQTDYHYWWTGHIHHDSKKDFVGATVESLRVLASEEAYAHQKGYRSGRDMKGIILHKEYGEVSRNTVNTKMLLTNT